MGTPKGNVHRQAPVSCAIPVPMPTEGVRDVLEIRMSGKKKNVGSLFWNCLRWERPFPGERTDVLSLRSRRKYLYVQQE